jgi:hypothetical protein
MGSIVSSVAQPVPGGSTGSGEGLFGRLIQQVINSGLISPVNEQSTQPSGITSIPVTNQNPTINMTGGRFNPVRDPKLNRVASRPMFRTSRYDGQINQLLGKLLPDFAPQMRPTTDTMGRSYSDPRYYKKGGRVGYADGTPAAGLAIKSLRPVNNNMTQEQIDQYINSPVPIGLMIPQNEMSPNETYLDFVKRKRKEEMYQISPTANIMPGTGGFPGGPLQQESIKEAMMSLPQTRSNPQMNAMRRYSQVRDPRMMRLMQMLKRQPAAMGGIMNLKMGGMPVEMDLRARGGFVPIGKKERADDVPARLSKNEFVFTANAVRNAGGGDIREGAKRMYNLMHKLEAKK